MGNPGGDEVTTHVPDYGAYLPKQVRRGQCTSCQYQCNCGRTTVTLCDTHQKKTNDKSKGMQTG